jgi:hypothetical protein
MAKKKTPSFLSARKILTPSEYEQYKKSKITIRRQALLEQMKQEARTTKYKQPVVYKEPKKYRFTRKGELVKKKFMGLRKAGAVLSYGIRETSPRVSRVATSGFKILSTKGGITKALYGIPLQESRVSSTHTGKRGRPAGTYDKRYAVYGGVYGFRKVLSTQLRQQRMEAMQRATISPQQQIILNQIRQRQMQEQMNPESAIIPSTNGQVPMNKIFQEIDDATRLVD